MAITKHCNLNCAYCFAFSPLSEEGYYNIDIFKKDINRVSELTARKIKDIAISGGEPLLHPKLTDFFDAARAGFDWQPKKNSGNIFIITNGTLLLKQPKQFWDSCAKNKIEIRITKYPISLNMDSIRLTAKEYGVKIIYWTCSTTRLVVSQVLQNARHFAVFSGCCLETEVSKQLYYSETDKVEKKWMH